ncbi:SDR family NAD(P)-dependent oxidoreductase [Actinosynnema sp. NPDC059797]
MWRDDRVALVTGAASGVAAAVARRLDAAGVRVAALDGCTAVDLVGGDLWRGMAVHADAGDPAQLESAVDAVVERYGRLDVLVATAPEPACPGSARSALEVTDEEWHAVLGPQLDGAFYAVRAALRVMRGGVVVAVVAACPHLPHRAAAALGVRGLVRAVDAPDVRVRSVTARCSPDPAEVADAVLAVVGGNA